MRDKVPDLVIGSEVKYGVTECQARGFYFLFPTAGVLWFLRVKGLCVVVGELDSTGRCMVGESDVQRKLQYSFICLRASIETHVE